MQVQDAQVRFHLRWSQSLLSRHENYFHCQRNMGTMAHSTALPNLFHALVTSLQILFLQNLS